MPRIFSLRTLVSALVTGITISAVGAAYSQSAGPRNGAAAITGTLEIVVKDDFDRGHSERSYFVRDALDDRLYELLFDRTPPATLRGGGKVTVRGRADGRTLWVDSLDTSGTTTTTTTAGDAPVVAASERRAVVLLVDLIDAKASSRYTVSQITSNMYTGSRSVDGLYRDSSHGQLGFASDTDGNGAPDVFGPFAINESKVGGDYYAWAYAAEAAATAAGIDLSKYQHRVFVMPRYNDLGTNWAGIANVGCGSFCRSWIAEGESPMVFAHELGHNLSMAHAGTDPENDGTTNSTYGDYSDPMGLSRAWHRFNGAHMDQMGWLGAFPGAVSTVVSSGTYQIAAIGSDPATATAPQTIKIEKPDTGEFYYLTYRQPTGYDDSLSSTYTRGVNVHRYRGSGYTVTNFVNSLTDGGVFQDPANEVTVTQLSHDGATATVEIAYVMTCDTATPTVGVSPSMHLVKPGATVDYSVSLTNQDGSGCAGTIFNMAHNSVQGTLAATSMTLAAGQAGSTSLRVDTTGLADGAYDARVTATDADGVDPRHASDGIGNLSIVVDGTAPTAPTGLSGASARKTKVALSWNASFDAVAGVKSYTVYRDGIAIGQTAKTGFTDSGTSSGATYAYTVTATDGVGNASAASAPVSVTVSSSGGKGVGKGGRKK